MARCSRALASTASEQPFWCPHWLNLHRPWTALAAEDNGGKMPLQCKQYIGVCPHMLYVCHHLLNLQKSYRGQAVQVVIGCHMVLSVYCSQGLAWLHNTAVWCFQVHALKQAAGDATARQTCSQTDKPTDKQTGGQRGNELLLHQAVIIFTPWVHELNSPGTYDCNYICPPQDMCMLPPTAACTISLATTSFLPP